MFCTLPLWPTNAFLISDVHNPASIRSSTKCGFIHTNSPANTLLVKTLDVQGSKLSLFPRIYEVEAVGIGASNKEFLAPYFITSSFNCSQSYLPEVGFLSHKSN